MMDEPKLKELVAELKEAGFNVVSQMNEDEDFSKLADAKSCSATDERGILYVCPLFEAPEYNLYYFYEDKDKEWECYGKRDSSCCPLNREFNIGKLNIGV